MKHQVLEKDDAGTKVARVAAAKLGLEAAINNVTNSAGGKGLRAVVPSIGGAEGLVQGGAYGASAPLGGSRLAVPWLARLV